MAGHMSVADAKYIAHYVAAIPHAVARYREAHPNAPDQVIDRYEAGLYRYARYLEREATTRITRKR